VLPVPRRPPDTRRHGRAYGRAPSPTPSGPAGRRAIASSLAVEGVASHERICVGAVLGAHGIGGAVRIKSFTAEPANLGSYGPVSDEAGVRSFEVSVDGVRPGCVVARLVGIAGRDAAAALRGTRLYIPRERLPEPKDDEFYHADLLGMTAETAAGEAPAMVPFTRAAVPTVDVAGRRLVVAPDAGLVDAGVEELVEA
jgi:16S rRNA processing protein RimM